MRGNEVTSSQCSRDIANNDCIQKCSRVSLRRSIKNMSGIRIMLRTLNAGPEFNTLGLNFDMLARTHTEIGTEERRQINIDNMLNN